MVSSGRGNNESPVGGQRARPAPIPPNGRSSPTAWFVFPLHLRHRPRFDVLARLPFSHQVARKQEKRSVLITNLAILGVIVTASLIIGFPVYFMVQFPIMIIAGVLGIWMFYVQHQYPTVYWARDDEWNRIEAALKGSSYYKLPKVLQWFTGNIGLHHIHHLRARIPNYNLQKCYDEVPEVRTVEPIPLKTSLKSLTCNLWDEKRRRI